MKINESYRLVGHGRTRQMAGHGRTRQEGPAGQLVGQFVRLACPTRVSDRVRPGVWTYVATVSPWAI